MKRLKNILLSCDPNTTTFREVYEGDIVLVDPMYPNMLPETDNDPTYYDGEIGYEFTATHKLAQDRPTVRISIPIDELLPEIDSFPNLSRLRRFLLTKYSTNRDLIDSEVEPNTNSNPDVNSDAKPGADFDSEYENRLCRALADTAADFCLRRFGEQLEPLNAELADSKRPAKVSGRYFIRRPSGEVLAGNSAGFMSCKRRDYDNGNGSRVYLRHDADRNPTVCLFLRMQVQLPERKIRNSIRMLCRDLPSAVSHFCASLDLHALEAVLSLADTQTRIREFLRGGEYCAFIANGSILPRTNDDKPCEGAIPFVSPSEAEISIDGIRGMGIRRGVNVITGGGYSGKSTLLDAISAGIYNHIAGDGRELVITDETAVTICAEDGRSVRHANISPFIRWIPRQDTSDFNSDHASGSTSQASNIMEAIDTGAKLLLIDEDRSATNFMIRDRIMRRLIDSEPIIPYTDRVGELHNNCVSTIVVVGGSSEYLAVADSVYMMDTYQLYDVTERTIKVASEAGLKKPDALPAADWSQHRTLFREGFTSYPDGESRERLEATDYGIILFGSENIDVRGLYNIVSRDQLDTLGFMLRYIAVTESEEQLDIVAAVDNMYTRIDAEGYDFLYSSYFTTCERFFSYVRKQELYAAINRMHGISYKHI